MSTVRFFDFFCSGVLIGSRTVLTAKHSFQFATQFPLFGATGVAFGIGPDAFWVRPAALKQTAAPVAASQSSEESIIQDCR
jgi:hypothetical protein